MDIVKGKICEYRSKLDTTLACNDLTDDQVLRNQILKSCVHDFGGNMENVVEARTEELSTLLKMLRSASSTNLANQKSGDMSDRSWNIKRDTEEFRVMYRKGPIETPFHELLVEGFVDGPIDVLLCISWESILYKEWWPKFTVPPFKVVSSDCIKRIRIGEEVSLVRMKLPWPLSDREALVHYFELDFFEKDLIVVLVNSLSDSKNVDRRRYGFTWEGIPDAGNSIRIDAVGGFAHLKVDANRSYFRTIARMDVKLDWIPPSLINFISRQIVASGFKLFKKEVESVSKGDKRFNEYLKGPLYEHIRNGLYSREVELSDLEPIKNVNAEKNIKPDEPLIVPESEGSTFRPVTETYENHAIDHVFESRQEIPHLSPQVKQALDTLDKVISIIQEHNRNAEERDKTEKENIRNHRISSNEIVLLDRDTDASAENGIGIAAVLSSRFKRTV